MYQIVSNKSKNLFRHYVEKWVLIIRGGIAIKVRADIAVDPEENLTISRKENPIREDVVDVTKLNANIESSNTGYLSNVENKKIKKIYNDGASVSEISTKKNITHVSRYSDFLNVK